MSSLAFIALAQVLRQSALKGHRGLLPCRSRSRFDPLTPRNSRPPPVTVADPRTETCRVPARNVLLRFTIFQAIDPPQTSSFTLFRLSKIAFTTIFIFPFSSLHIPPNLIKVNEINFRKNTQNHSKKVFTFAFTQWLSYRIRPVGNCNETAHSETARTDRRTGR